MPFSTLGLSPTLTSPLARLGYTQPTPVQTASIPIVLDGSDLLARAQTGTGKTAAFGLPMIDRLVLRSTARRGAARRPRGLVLVPTRELAAQVHASLTRYGAPARLRVVAIYGGVAMSPQVHLLQRGADIVVATPGRLLDHVQQRTIDLSTVEILTLDEADRMLDMGFLPALRQIARLLPADRQTLLLSATFSPDIMRLSGEFTRTPVHVDVSPVVVAPTVTHRVYPVADGRKNDLLVHVLMQAPVGQALVFCKTKRGADRVGTHLDRTGVRTAVIHGNKSQGQRRRALDDFKSGRVAVLVATDIAARGLDIAELPLVVNYDLPLVASDYIHRIGRTGRAGLAGRAISLLIHADRSLLRDIQRLLPEPIEEVRVEGYATGRDDRPVAAPERRVPRHGTRRAAPVAGRRGKGRASRTALRT